jgi:hypothetical protein
LQRREEGGRRDAVETREGNGAAAEVYAGIEIAVPFVPQDLPITRINTGIPSSSFQGVTSPSISHDMGSSPETFVEVPAGTPSSPTFSISTISDMTPTELGDDIQEGNNERMTTRHETFYFEDGNVEILSGSTVFRVHSTIISFSSPKLRDILSQSALLHVLAPEGPPRITVTDSVVDFAVLLKMIYTPGCVSSIPHAGSVN